MIDGNVAELVCYAIRTGLIKESDRVWAENALITALGLDSYRRPVSEPEDERVRQQGNGNLHQQLYAGGYGLHTEGK